MFLYGLIMILEQTTRLDKLGQGITGLYSVKLAALGNPGGGGGLYLYKTHTHLQ